ncbi:hypothetical protein EJB05_09624, partial [Eragrostis curvula]
MSNPKVLEKMSGSILCAMAKVAVDRSCGQVEAFLGKWFVTNDLLKYIADRSPSLKVLRLSSCYIANIGVAWAIKEFPLLEDLELSLCLSASGEYVLETIGTSCTLTRFQWCGYTNGKAMGTTMTKLHSLQLFGSSLNNSGLAAILDNCPNIESLDIRYFFNIKMDDALREKCAGIRSVRLPHDSIDDYEFKDNLPCWLHKAFWSGQLAEIQQTTKFKNHNLRLARIKKIMKTDSDVQRISGEAPMVFAKACEMFIQELMLRGWHHAQENKRTLQKNDITEAIARTEVFDFMVPSKKNGTTVPPTTTAVQEDDDDPYTNYYECDCFSCPSSPDDPDLRNVTN